MTAPTTLRDPDEQPKDVTLPPVVVIAGPTASGKSALALELAEAVNGTIINADSLQMYRDLPLLTAQPDAAATRRVPHRLYGILDAAERGSVGRWRDAALAEIAQTQGAGRLPIVVGGTGLYLRALTTGPRRHSGGPAGHPRLRPANSIGRWVAPRSASGWRHSTLWPPRVFRRVTGSA